MRRHGALTSAASLVPVSHLGWGYHDRNELGLRLAEYVADGIACNQRIEYVGGGSRNALCAELTGFGFDEGVRSGRIRVTPADDTFEFCPGSELIDAEATVVERVAATEEALSDGYSGLRAVIDAVAVARTPEQRTAWAHFEYLIDQEMAVLPLSAMCAYDLAALGTAAAELLCLHPFAAEGTVGFRLFAEPGFSFVLAGEIDAADNDAFGTAVQRIWHLQPPGPLLIDARALTFITHHQLTALDEYARADRRDVVLLSDQPIVSRLAELLRLTNLRVAPAAVTAP